MKRFIAICAVCAILLSVLSGCDNEANQNESLLESNFENESAYVNKTDEEEFKESITDIIRRIAATRPTLSEFKQTFSNCRTVRESIDGSYFYIDISTPELPGVLFSFERVFGKNGYSQIYLTSINAGADILLPEYLNVNIDDILENEGKYAFYDEISEGDIIYGDVYIYRKEFYYYIQGYVHLNTLSKGGIYLKLYNDDFFSPIEQNDLDIDKNTEPLSEMLAKLVKNRCTLEQFKTNFDDWRVVKEDNDSIVIVCDSIKDIEFKFSTFTDSIGNCKRMLAQVSAPAELLMPLYIGLNGFELREQGLELPKSNAYYSRSLYLYKKEYCLCVNLYTDTLESKTTVYMMPYTDSWVSPW